MYNYDKCKNCFGASLNDCWRCSEHGEIKPDKHQLCKRRMSHVYRVLDDNKVIEDIIAELTDVLDIALVDKYEAYVFAYNVRDAKQLYGECPGEWYFEISLTSAELHLRDIDIWMPYNDTVWMLRRGDITSELLMKDTAIAMAEVVSGIVGTLESSHIFKDGPIRRYAEKFEGDHPKRTLDEFKTWGPFFVEEHLY